MAKKTKSNPFPVELVVVSNGAGTYDTSLTREDAAANQDGTEDRIAIYTLVKVLRPKTELIFEEVNNE